ncbi:uncharacterized protein NP_1558A [Natronomonas pharaonis DSM 2160]|uniref:Uncharacterized protein n=1 Tax=Natronomonas pharaonis (strain ATCC 35678 / DSM 2160 / CIP 103997 / JCM 8858 / NBRC 14720 / NCIMB 2260 / Gabara) TaxID=348780 RepID=A0A1U7EV35_NATPD|nr:uncharacterized protein NP_1558A [Natronomonas pharaonis DSM 2160]
MEETVVQKSHRRLLSDGGGRQTTDIYRPRPDTGLHTA